jgi:hypothetical protein
MTYLDHLPAEVAHLIRSGFLAEFATVSVSGVPIDTPLVTFTSEDLETIDAGTGLAYPAKAERARRNPKTGLLFEGGKDQPVVSIAGMATVRDSDFQANLERYLSEEILAPYLNPSLVDYDSVTRHAIWYFTRILICVKPAIVRWWHNREAVDGKPEEWHAPLHALYPSSDRAPPGEMSKAPWRAHARWEVLAESALARKAPGHLTLLDAQGFPLPIRAREVHAHAAGFRLIMPQWLPWSAGRATLSFEGVETFVGNARIAGTEALLHVERAMPVLPMMADLTEVLHPKPATKAALMERLDYETKRRGVPLPTMPSIPPEPTAGARLRAESADSYGGLSAADR